jgi:hypothetical protein
MADPFYEDWFTRKPGRPARRTVYQLPGGRYLVTAEPGFNACIPCSVEMLLRDHQKAVDRAAIDRYTGYTQSRGAQLISAAAYLKRAGLAYHYVAGMDRTISSLTTILGRSACILEYGQPSDPLGHVIVADFINTFATIAIRDSYPRIGAGWEHINNVLREWTGNAIIHEDVLEHFPQQTNEELDIF